MKYFRYGIPKSGKKPPGSGSKQYNWTEIDKNAEALYDTYEKLPDINMKIPDGLNL